MALMKCPECNNNVSDMANACPHCGYGIKDYVKTLKDIILCPKCGSSGDCHSSGVCCICDTKAVNTHKKYSTKDSWELIIKKKNDAFEELKTIGLYDPKYREIQQMVFRGTYTSSPTKEESELSDRYNAKLVEMRERDGYYDKKPEPRPTPEKIIIKCPNCGSTNTKRVTATSRMAGVLTLGLASSSIGKQYMCKRCKYKW